MWLRVALRRSPFGSSFQLSAFQLLPSGTTGMRKRTILSPEAALFA
jgi:hypothetical protein